MHIRHFLISCLLVAGSWFVGLGERLDYLLSTALDRIGDMWRVAFPPDPLHVEQFTSWRLSASRLAAPFIAFIDRARRHDQYLGGRFKLLRSPLLAV